MPPASFELMELQFVASESTFDYFASTRRYLERHGKPVAFYSDTRRTESRSALKGRRRDRVVSTIATPPLSIRASLGLMLKRMEVYAAYDHVKIDSVDLGGPILGARLWL